MSEAESTSNERRTGVIRMSEGDLRNLLDLPEHYRIRAIQSTFDPAGFVLLVESPTLPSVPYDAESPPLRGAFQQVRRYDPGTDKVWARWEWELG